MKTHLKLKTQAIAGEVAPATPTLNGYRNDSFRIR